MQRCRMTNIKHPDLTFCPPTQTSDHQLSRINIQPTGQHLAKACKCYFATLFMLPTARFGQRRRSLLAPYFRSDILPAASFCIVCVCCRPKNCWIWLKSITRKTFAAEAVVVVDVDVGVVDVAVAAAAVAVAVAVAVTSTATSADAAT